MSKTTTGDRIVDKLTNYPFDPDKANTKVLVDISADALSQLNKMADERGISIDHLVNAVLHYQIERIENGLISVTEPKDDDETV